MNLSNYDIIYMGKKAEELGFIRDTLEKVTRLGDVLEYININPLLRESLALKGGTAINFTIFNLPRLSVDIDIICPPKTDIEKYLSKNAEQYGFNQIKLIDRKSENAISKNRCG